MSNSKQNNNTNKSKPRQKQIKLSHIESQHKQINKMNTYTLDEEKNLVIKYYSIFPESKIEELLKELNEAILYTEENKLSFFKTDEQFYKYLHLLIIRKMTSLESEIPKDFSSQVSIMTQIIDIGLFRTLFDEVIDGNEVLKVIERVEEMVTNVAKIAEATQKELSKLERLKNNNILNKPFNVLADPSLTDGLIQ